MNRQIVYQIMKVHFIRPQSAAFFHGLFDHQTADAGHASGAKAHLILTILTFWNGPGAKVRFIPRKNAYDARFGPNQAHFGT